MNIFDMRGPDFLIFYLGLAGVCLVISLVLPRMLSGPFDLPMFSPKLDPYEIAFLAGGKRSAVHAALAALKRRGLVKISTAGASVEGTMPADLSPWEKSMFLAIDRSKKFRDVCTAMDPATLRPALEKDQLILETGRSVIVKLAAIFPMLVVMALGIIKICVGVDRGKPIAFLVILTIAAGIVLLVVQKYVGLRTVRGSRVLGAMRIQNAPLKTAAKARTDLNPADFAIAVALFGPAMLAGESMLRQYMIPPGTSGGSSCGSSCGGGGGGGGGCGGCGGGD